MKRLILAVALFAGILPAQTVVVRRRVVVPASGSVTVTKIGSCDCNYAASCNITATSGVASGHGVVIVASGSSTSATFAATDSASPGNTYQTDVPLVTQNGTTTAMLSGAMAHAIAASGTITVTPSNGTSAHWYFTAYDLSVMKSSGWLDKAASNTPGYGATWATGTTSATTHQPNINIIVFVASVNNTVSNWNGYTALDTALVGPAGRYLYTGWKEVTSTGTQSGSIVTTPTSDLVAAGIASYMEN